MLFTKDGISAFHSWTHDRVDQLIKHAAGIPPQLFVAPLPGFARVTVRDQLLHVLSCESNWIRGLQHLPATDWQPEDFGTALLLRNARHHVMGETREYLDALTEDQLNATLDRVPKEWVGPSRSPGFILHHILTHAFHHKGQIVAMFRILGYPAPDTDLQRMEP
jgi:uncharacterized damage-inducible protein DinB